MNKHDSRINGQPPKSQVTKKLAARICPVRNNTERNNPETRNIPEHIHKSRKRPF